jgi:hypothetical protein
VFPVSKHFLKGTSRPKSLFIAVLKIIVFIHEGFNKILGKPKFERECNPLNKI